LLDNLAVLVALDRVSHRSNSPPFTRP